MVASIDLDTHGLTADSLKLTLSPGTITPMGDPYVTSISDPAGPLKFDNTSGTQVASWAANYSLKDSFSGHQIFAIVFYGLQARSEQAGMSCMEGRKAPRLSVTGHADPFVDLRIDEGLEAQDIDDFKSLLSNKSAHRDLVEWKSTAVGHLDYENKKIGGDSGWNHWPTGFPP
jgi:hypothetical protein